MKTGLETMIFPFFVVLALALGEAFKQYVSEKDNGNFQWDRTLALLTFLFLILPFYQGMNRYLTQTYGMPSPNQPFPGKFLIADGVSFLFESALFFAMSRNLANSRWRYFYSIVLALLVVDSLWGWSALQHAGGEAADAIHSWIKLNVGASVFLILLIFLGRRFLVFLERFLDVGVAGIGTVAMLVRTVIDYRISWDFYFSAIK